MRTKACIHTLTGHTSTVAVVKAQAAEPQVSKMLDLPILAEKIVTLVYVRYN